MDARNAPTPQLLWILWGSMLVSLAIYGFIPFFVAWEHETPGSDALVIALGGVAVSTAVATFVLRRLLLAAPIANRSLDPSTPAGRARIFQAHLFCWVLSESVGLYGLVLFFLYGSRPLLYGFLAGAFVLMLLHAPRQIHAGPATDRARPDVKIG